MRACVRGWLRACVRACVRVRLARARALCLCVCEESCVCARVCARVFAGTRMYVSVRACGFVFARVRVSHRLISSFSIIPAPAAEGDLWESLSTPLKFCYFYHGHQHQCRHLSHIVIVSASIKGSRRVMPQSIHVMNASSPTPSDRLADVPYMQRCSMAGSSAARMIRFTGRARSSSVLRSRYFERN